MLTRDKACKTFPVEVRSAAFNLLREVKPARQHRSERLVQDLAMAKILAGGPNVCTFWAAVCTRRSPFLNEFACWFIQVFSVSVLNGPFGDQHGPFGRPFVLLPSSSCVP